LIGPKAGTDNQTANLKGENMKTLKELQLDYHRETDLSFDTARAAWIAGASAAEAQLIYREIANPAKDIFIDWVEHYLQIVGPTSTGFRAAREFIKTRMASCEGGSK